MAREDIFFAHVAGEFNTSATRNLSRFAILEWMWLILYAVCNKHNFLQF